VIRIRRPSRRAECVADIGLCSLQFVIRGFDIIAAQVKMNASQCPSSVLEPIDRRTLSIRLASRDQFVHTHKEYFDPPQCRDDSLPVSKRLGRILQAPRWREDEKFESGFLQKRVCKPSVPHRRERCAPQAIGHHKRGMTRFTGARVLEVRIHLPPPLPQQLRRLGRIVGEELGPAMGCLLNTAFRNPFPSKTEFAEDSSLETMSARKIPSNLPRSASRARSCQYPIVLYSVERSRGCVHIPCWIWPTQFMSNALRRISFVIGRVPRPCGCGVYQK